MKTYPDHATFTAKHHRALADLLQYALDDQADADALNPVLHAETVAEMVQYAPNLYRYAPCSVFIDDLYHALLDLAVQS